MATTQDKLIYALVARGKHAILSNYSGYTGNFETKPLYVLGRLNLDKTMG